jgi:hypothetical protein
MPANDFERHYACIDWFAHWSQRVIPPHLWREALMQARKILLPMKCKTNTPGFLSHGQHCDLTAHQVAQNGSSA